MQLQQEKQIAKTICYANVGYSPTPRQHFCKTAAPKNFLFCAVFHVKHCMNALRETNCIRFGRIASLSAFVLFAGGYVVRIAYESFLDYSLLEVFCFQDGEQHLSISPRFLLLLIVHSLQGTAVPCTPRQAEPA